MDELPYPNLNILIYNTFAYSETLIKARQIILKLQNFLSELLTVTLPKHAILFKNSFIKKFIKIT